MTDSTVALDIAETTNRLAQIIRHEYEENTCGSVKGYLVMNDIRGVIPKEERKNFSAMDTKGVFVPCHGSVKCSETAWLTRSLTAMIIAYAVRNNLLEMFRDYPFKKFEIELESYPKYNYAKNRLWKYRRTGDDLSFLKIDMEW